MDALIKTLIPCYKSAEMRLCLEFFWLLKLFERRESTIRQQDCWLFAAVRLIADSIGEQHRFETVDHPSLIRTFNA